MTRTCIALAVFVFAALLNPCDLSAAPNTKDEIDRFNQRLIQLHLNMDHAGILALWADDGVDLMPDTAPMVGKPAITAWLNDVLANFKDYKVAKQEMEFHDIRLSGDWASEWATVHQAVQPPDGKPLIESYGKIAFVLRRAPTGEWKITQEMWNSAPNPNQQTKQ